MSGQRLRIAVIAGISAVVLAGCGGDGDKGSPAEPSKPAAVDLSTLDTGKYATLPRGLGQVASEQEGRMAEAFRMAEAVPDPSRVDSALDGTAGRIPEVNTAGVAPLMTGVANPVVEPVLVKYGMICAHVALASNETSMEAPETDSKAIQVVLMRFPDEASAGNAAVEIDATDFAVNPENVAVPVTKYPEARGHWRPSHPSMASTLARGEFVIWVLAQNPTANLKTLTGMVEKMFDETIELLDGFEPTPVDKIAKLPKDPDKLLGRLVELSPTEPPLSERFVTYGANGASALQTAGQIKGRVFEKAGVDQFANWYVPKQGGASILRAREHDAAVTLMDDMISTNDDLDHPVDGPQGLPDAKCFEKRKDSYSDPARRFICYLRYDRYVANVTSADEADVRQRAAAQYALLVNPL